MVQGCKLLSKIKDQDPDQRSGSKSWSRSKNEDYFKSRSRSKNADYFKLIQWIKLARNDWPKSMKMTKHDLNNSKWHNTNDS